MAQAARVVADNGLAAAEAAVPAEVAERSLVAAVVVELGPGEAEANSAAAEAAVFFASK